MENTFEKQDDKLIVTIPQEPVIESYTLKQINDNITAFEEAVANSTSSLEYWNGLLAKAQLLEINQTD